MNGAGRKRALRIVVSSSDAATGWGLRIHNFSYQLGNGAGGKGLPKIPYYWSVAAFRPQVACNTIPINSRICEGYPPLPVKIA